MTGARRRLEEAEQRHRVASEERDQIQAAITRRLARGVLTDDLRIDALISSETIPSAADLLASEVSTLSAEELQPHVEEAFAAVVETRRMAEGLPEEKGLPGWTAARRYLKIARDDWDAIRSRTYNEVVERNKVTAREREEREARKNDPFGFSRFNIPMPAIRVPGLGVLPPAVRDRSRMDRLSDQREQSDRDVALSGAELALARRAVVAIGRPRGLFWSLCVLTVLAVLGLVIPVIELWGEPLAGDANDRLVTLVCFMIGLALLIAYLWIYAFVLWRRQGSSGVSATALRVRARRY